MDGESETSGSPYERSDTMGTSSGRPSDELASPIRSVRNFQVLLYALAELWETPILQEPKLKQAIGIVFGSFMRSDEADGYLFQISSEERETAVSRLTPEGSAVATALAYLGLRPKSDWTNCIFEWQAWLRPCLQEGVIRATQESAAFTSRVCSEQVTVASLGDRLDWARDYIDDPQWCLKMMAKTCHLQDVWFSRKRFAVELVLEVRARVDLVDDPGVVKLIRNALDFRRADGVVIMSGVERISVRLGEAAVARLKTREVVETQGPVTESDLALLEAGGLPLGERLTRLEDEAAAS